MEAEAERAALSVHEVSRDRRLYRVVHGDDRDSQEFLDSLRSNYELNRPPRQIEQRSSVVHMGLSMYDRAAQAAQMARAFPKIGDAIAEVDLTVGRGFNLADTGPPGHFTVWGRPMQLAEVIGDIYPVENQ